MRRFKHSLSHYKLLTCDMGELVPISCFEVLPGDSIQHGTSLLIRVSPLLAPVMHPVQVRVHHWFVPHRLVWEYWEDFITGGPSGTGPPASYPVINGPFGAGELGDYLGIPPGVSSPVGAFPVRSYQLIWQEFYRDQDLIAEPVSLDNGTLRKVAWGKDYFTTARPWPQKGPTITLPLGTSAPVVSDGTGVPSFTVPGGTGATLQSVASQNDARFSITSPSIGNASWTNPALRADLSGATAVDVNTVRRAFALQRYQEARAQFGSRYTEYLRYLGVRSSDARLQRPEYLGGGKATIAFSEVLQTGPEDVATGQIIGQMRGHGISAMRSRRYRRFFEEHGLVMSLLSVRPKSIYQDGLARMFGRRTKEDYWQKELELIGQQEVKNNEIFFDAAAGTNVFGWQDRYAEYRHEMSKVAGDFRSTLDYWHMARKFASLPVLNQSFVECDPTKRINAVQTEDVLWIMANHSIQARRMVRNASVGRII